MAVKELIKELKMCDPNARVVWLEHEAHLTDAGTDLGFDTEQDVSGITDLETKVVVEKW